MNDADKKGLSPSMGFAFNDQYTLSVATTPAVNVAVSLPYQASATAGHRINFNSTTENLIFEYSMPLIGILGCNTTNKMIPIGALFGLRYELTMDSFSKFVAEYTSNLTTACTISEFEFVGNVIELAPEAQSIIEAANPEKIHIRTSTYRQASNSLAGGTGSGTNDLLVGVRVSSLKSCLLCCSPANAQEGKFAGVNPNLDQGTCFIIAGQSYPQRTLNPSGHPSDCYMELQKAFGALSYANFNGCINRGAYFISSAAYGLCSAYAASNTGQANLMISPNQFYLGVDTEVVARKDSLLSGLNVNSSPMFFRAQIGSTALAASQTHTFNFWGYYDVILELDVASKNMVAKF